MSSSAERETKLRDRLRIEQAQWLKLWHDCAQFCCPHKAAAVRSSQAAEVTKPAWNPQQQNSVAMRALSILAGGCRSWILPGGGEGWGGQWEPHPHLSGSHKVADWLADCTRRSVPLLEAGGFFTAGHEMFSDLGVFGTAGMFVDEGQDHPVVCHAKPPSEFVFMRDWEGAVSRVIVTYRKKAQELYDMFGAEAVPERVRADVAGERPDELHEVIHSIYRRGDAEVQAEAAYPDDPAGMRFASCWIHVAEKKVLREGGYQEMPFVAPRWLTWSDASGYGTSPAMQALADLRGVNLLEMLMSVLAELQVNPRIKGSPAHTGAVDLSPGGYTQMSADNSVAEWAPAGQFGAGEAMIARKENQIMQAFHADLFQAISPIVRQRELTNYVAQALEREAAANISPAMGRVASDFINPVMLRIFMVLFRAGVFAEPPDEAYYQDSAGRRYLVFPRVAQTSRMSQALNSRNAFAFNSAMSRLAPIASAKPDIFDLYDFEKIARDLDRGDGMPPGWHHDEEAVAKIRQGRAEQQQAAMAQQVMAQAAANKPTEVAALAGLTGPPQPE